MAVMDQDAASAVSVRWVPPTRRGRDAAEHRPRAVVAKPSPVLTRPLLIDALDRRDIVKTMIDRVVALTLILVISPLLVAIALAVWMTSPGGALFFQERVGKNGRTFRMIKFRTMVADAEQLLIDLRPNNDCDGVLFKLRNDPRSTPVGRWLRRFSLDELPQLWNILKGDMSLVGPRPALPDEVANYDERTMGRLTIRPGLTGLWQVSGRADLSWEKSIELDLHYAQHLSFALDALILIKSIPAVVTGRGAY